MNEHFSPRVAPATAAITFVLPLVGCFARPEASILDARKNMDGTTLVTIMVDCKGTSQEICASYGIAKVFDVCAKPPRRELSRKITSEAIELQIQCSPQAGDAAVP